MRSKLVERACLREMEARNTLERTCQDGITDYEAPSRTGRGDLRNWWPGYRDGTESRTAGIRHGAVREQTRVMGYHLLSYVYILTFTTDMPCPTLELFLLRICVIANSEALQGIGQMVIQINSDRRRMRPLELRKERLQFCKSEIN